MPLTHRLAIAPHALTKPLGALNAVSTLLARSEEENCRELATVLAMIHGDLAEAIAEVSERLSPR